MAFAICHGSRVFNGQFHLLSRTQITNSRCKRTCEANAAGENSSLIFTVCFKSVPLYHFKLANVVLRMAVKEFFGNPPPKMEN